MLSSQDLIPDDLQPCSLATIKSRITELRPSEDIDQLLKKAEEDGLIISHMFGTVKVFWTPEWSSVFCSSSPAISERRTATHSTEDARPATSATSPARIVPPLGARGGRKPFVPPRRVAPSPTAASESSTLTSGQLSRRRPFPSGRTETEEEPGKGRTRTNEPITGESRLLMLTASLEKKKVPLLADLARLVRVPCECNCYDPLQCAEKH